jgi:hypothetical protein
LWVATRGSTEADYGELAHLGALTNDAMVSGPSLSADEKTLFFSSRRRGGHGNLISGQ